VNSQKLNRLFVERINSLAPYLRGIPDDGLRQEASIGVYLVLKSDPEATDRYLINGAKWNQSRSLKKGRSVDNGFYKREYLPIVHYDQLPIHDGVFSQVIPSNGGTPLDNRVIDKICLEKLLDDLTQPETEVFRYKVLEELHDKQIKRKLRIGHEKLKGIKAELRYKIDRAFADQDFTENSQSIENMELVR